MSKAIQGAAMLGGALAMGVAAFFDPALVASPFYDKLMASLVLGGISMEAGAIASALTSNRGMNITTRQAAAYRQIVRGTQRVGGVTVYQSTTGSSHDQYNFIIVLAGHEVDCIENLYLDGRKVYWLGSGGGYTVRNGIGFGGVADNNTYTGPDGQPYNFGGTGHSGIYCEARFGDQSDGDVISGMTANDPQWAAVGGRSPWLGGCCYIYLKIEYNPSLFPSAPEIKLTVRGKNNIWDPRTSSYGFTNNWALLVADTITDPTWGLGDDSVNQAQLIAAANLCDEQVTLAGGGTESRYCCDYTCDAGVGPGDVLDTMMPGAAGRLSRIGGEWFIWPAAWTASSFTFDKSALTGPVQWSPNRSLRDLFNSVRGTYIAANYPYNVAGNLYDSNGWYNGGIANNFPYAFQPTNFPEYAADTRHGFASDAFLEDDSGVLGAWSSSTTYDAGDVVTYSGGIWRSLQAANTNHLPNATGSTWWAAYAAHLPKELALRTVLSVSQAQRVAKITLLRNRQQGSGSFAMQLDCYRMQPQDVMSFSFPELGWTSKVLEVFSTNFRVQPGSSADGAPSVRVDIGVQETDSSVYDWTPSTDELTPYDLPAGVGPGTSPRGPAAPTGLTAISNATTAVISADGATVVPRIALNWTAPADAITNLIQIQHQLHASGNWIDDGTVSAAFTVAYVSGIVAGSVYDVRIRGIRSSTGATSDWLEVDSITAAAPGSLQPSYSIAPQFVLTQPTSTSIALAACAASFGSRTANYSARTFTISTPGSPTWYYVTIADATQQGESSPVLTATCQTSNALVGVQGNTYLGAILALPGGSATQILAGGWPAPQTVQVQ